MKFGVKNMVDPIESILLKHPKDAFISQEHLEEQYKEHHFLGVPNYEKSLEEYEQFVEILEEYIDDIYYLPKDDRTTIDSIYAHDSIKMTAKGPIYMNMGKEQRKGEPTATKEYLDSLGIPSIGDMSPEELGEGGDVLLLDEDTAFVGISYRTNMAGYEKVKDITKDFIQDVYPIQLPYYNGPEEILHITSFISPVDHKLAVTYSPLMPIYFREMLLEKGYEFIEVDKKEYDQLGTNVLALAPKVVVLNDRCPETARKLREKGCTVHTYSGENISLLGMGGPTCLTHPLYRKE